MFAAMFQEFDLPSSAGLRAGFSQRKSVNELIAAVRTVQSDRELVTCETQERMFGWELTKGVLLMSQGLDATFNAHPALLEELEKTSGDYLVEADIIDRIWSVGMSVGKVQGRHPRGGVTLSPILDRFYLELVMGGWEGKIRSQHGLNLFGRILMRKLRAIPCSDNGMMTLAESDCRQESDNVPVLPGIGLKPDDDACVAATEALSASQDHPSRDAEPSLMAETPTSVCSAVPAAAGAFRVQPIMSTVDAYLQESQQRSNGAEIIGTPDEANSLKSTKSPPDATTPTSEEDTLLDGGEVPNNNDVNPTSTTTAIAPQSTSSQEQFDKSGSGSGTGDDIRLISNVDLPVAAADSTTCLSPSEPNNPANESAVLMAPSIDLDDPFADLKPAS
jgi:predicted NAD-dependent protein-ADP-ribosyltransferase YbiA (DUF1768 family)